MQAMQKKQMEDNKEQTELMVRNIMDLKEEIKEIKTQADDIM